MRRRQCVLWTARVHTESNGTPSQLHSLTRRLDRVAPAKVDEHMHVVARNRRRRVDDASVVARHHFDATVTRQPLLDR